MMNSRRCLIRVFVVCVATLAWSAVSAQAQSETFSGTASLKTAGGVNANAPVTITIDRFATDADQAALVAAAKSGGTAARDWLAKRADAGSLQVGGRKMPIKYAYVRKTAGGRLITVATAEPIALAPSLRGPRSPGDRSRGFERSGLSPTVHFAPDTRSRVSSMSAPR